MKSLNIGQAIRYGFNAFKSHIGFFLLCGLIAGILHHGIRILLSLIVFIYAKEIQCGPLLSETKAIDCLMKYIQHESYFNPITVLIIIMGIVSMIVVGIWNFGMYMNVSLQIRDKGTASLKDLYSFIPQLSNLFFTAFMVGLITCFGLIAFIIPGIYWLGRSWFANFVVLDENVGNWTAIKKSLAISKGHGWQLVGLLFVLILIISISSLLGLGLMRLCGPLTGDSLYCVIPTGLFSLVALWAIGVVTMLISVDAYRQLNPKR